MRALALVVLVACGGTEPAAQAPTPVGNVAPATPDAPPADPAPWQDEKLPPSCLRYLRTMQILAACDRLPAESRDAYRQMLATTAAAWANLGEQDAESWQQLAAACEHGADDFAASGRAMGCAL